MNNPLVQPAQSNPIGTPAEVLVFWLGDALQSDWPAQNRSPLWFGGGAEQDRQIAERFGALVHLALAGGLEAWEENLPSRLALILLLDQFTRHVYRGQARAFAGDGRAQQLVLRTLEAGGDVLLPRVGRVFLYMPLMHAEHLDLQESCVHRFAQLVADAPPALQPTLANHLKFAREHRDIVAAHGRFPHRNAALGRSTTPAEEEFLKNGPRYGQ
ncbi:MAG: DUF924 domain-containing protein [Hydrogenophaga sp.]|jgi:uncharacterized protein (DUF924 family)|nr:DUF924 domain-containing protein [Hydrogenophaga sp.]